MDEPIPHRTLKLKELADVQEFNIREPTKVDACILLELTPFGIYFFR